MGDGLNFNLSFSKKSAHPLRDKHIIWLYLFLIATIVDLSFLTDQNESMRVYSKPVILLGLILYFYFISKPIASTLLAKTILAALLFSWLGDVLLLWSDLFIYGLGAFLMAHVCYIFGFRLAQKSEGRLDSWYFIRTFFYNIPIFLVAGMVFYFIYPNLGGLKIPVIAYILVIVGMVTTARARFKKVNAASFWQVLIGALFFLVSDGILALARFYKDFPEAGILIMGTYATAQLLLVMGIRSYLVGTK